MSFVKDVYVETDCKDDEVEWKYFKDPKCAEDSFIRTSKKTEAEYEPGQEVECFYTGMSDIYTTFKPNGWVKDEEQKFEFLLI